MFDGLIVNQLKSNESLTGMLTTYNGEPAIFYQKAPEDTDEGWASPQYPRIDFNIDMREDAERKVSGILALNIWCNEESPVMPEDVEPVLIDIISGTFYTGRDKITLCAVWNRSDAFDYIGASAGNQKDKNTPKAIGITMMFDIMAFPVQLTTDPDPVHAFNEWTKAMFKNALIVAHDELAPVWKPSCEEIAIYWRINDISASNRQTHNVTWYDISLAGHIIGGAVPERAMWLKAMEEALRIDGEVLLQDKSPLFIDTVTMNMGADILRVGQITVKGTYGVLNIPRKVPTPMKLMHANFSYGNMDDNNN